MKSKTSSLEDIDVTQLKASHFIKFAFLSTNKMNVPKCIAYFCYIMNQLQTFAMIWKNADISLKEDLSITSSFSSFYLNIFISSHWISNENITSIITILIVILVYFLIMMLFACYLHLKIHFKDPIPSYMQTFWSSVTYLHFLVFYFPIHVFTLEILKRYYKNELFDDSNPAILVMLIFNLIINSLLVGGAAKYYVMIKTKDPLSSKNNFMLRWDQGSKCVTAILWLFVEYFEGLKILILIFSLIDVIFRDLGFFYVLPYYRIYMLWFTAIMQAPISILAVLTLVTKVLSLTGLEVGKAFTLIAWAILTPFTMMIYSNVLRNVLMHVFFSEAEILNSYQICHKRYIARYFAKKRIEPHKEMRKFDLFYFVYRGKTSYFLKHLDLSDPSVCFSKEFLQGKIKNLMISTIKKYPKNEFNRISLAYYYVKYENSYLLAQNLIEEVRNDGPSFPTLISLVFINLELKKKLFLQYSAQGDSSEGSQSLNIRKYVQIHDVYSEMKMQMDQQVKLQISFWNHYLSTKPDMGVLAEICTKINKKKNDVQKVWNKLSKVNDPKFSAPILLHGLYLCFVNNDPVAGEKYIESYHNNMIKYSAITQHDELTDNTLFCEENLQITMSGMRTKLGRILDCSSNISNVLGWKKSFLVDRSINTIMSPYYREKHDGILTKHYNTGNTKLLNRTLILQVLSQDGYLISTWIHIKISPMVDTGLFYVAIMRPVKNQKAFLLIRNDGTIDGMSKQFAKDMNITNQQEQLLNIFSYCPNFELINEAFNEIAYKTIIENASSLMKPDTNRLHSLSTKNSNNFAHSGPNLDERHERYGMRFRKQSSSRLKSFTLGSYEHQKKIMQIFENFTDGAKLIFYPQGANNEKSKNKPFKRYKSNREPVIYTTKITTRIHGKDFIKEVILEKVPYDYLENGELDLDDPSNQYLKMNSCLEKHDETRIISFENIVHSTPVYNVNQNNAEDEEVSSDLSVLDEKQAKSSPKEKIVHELAITKLEHLIKDHQADETPISRGQDGGAVITLFRGDSSARLLIKNSGTHNDESPRPLAIIKNHISGKDRFQMIVNQARGVPERTDTSFRNKTSIEVNEKNQPKRENLLKMKIKKLREKLNRGIVDAAKAENSISSSYLSKGTKIQGIITQALRMDNKKKSAVIFRHSFLIFVLVSILINVIQVNSIQMAIKDIQIKTLVIEKGFFRTKALLRNAGNVRVWVGVLERFISLTSDLQTDNEVMRNGTLATTKDLKLFNNDLRIEVSKIDESFQNLFYKKDVRIYQRREENTFELLNKDSNFEAIGLIISRAYRMFNRNISIQSISSIDTQDLKFILDNSYNDLLISSENSVEILLQDLYQTLENIRTILIILSGISLAVAVVFVIFCLRYLLLMRTNSESFMIIFFRLDNQGVQETRSMLKNFIESLESNMLDFQISEENERKTNNSNNNNIVKNHKIFHKASMDKFFRKQILLLAKILPFYFGFVAWTIIYFFIATNIISEIDSYQIQIQSSLETQNQQELAIREFIELIATNSTVNVRNRPIEEDFTANLDKIQKIDELINKFRRKDNSLTESQRQIFFDFPCDQFSPEESTEFIKLQTSCFLISKGTGTVGLANLNAEIYATTSQIYDSYRISAKSQQDLMEQLLQIVAKLRNQINLASGLLLRLHQATSNSFQDKANQLQREAVIFTTIEIVLKIVLGLFVFIRILQEIIDYEAKDRQILQLVPIKQILSNRYLKQHLVQNSNGGLDVIKRFI